MELTANFPINSKLPILLTANLLIRRGPSANENAEKKKVQVLFFRCDRLQHSVNL